MSWTVEFSRSAERDLGRLGTRAQERLRSRIRQLTENPRPIGSRKLSGEESYYRIRVGEYRVLYEISDDARLVVIIAVGHRSRVYRRLRR